MGCSPPGSSVGGISQIRILEWVATSFSRGFSWPRDQTHVSYVAGSLLLCWWILNRLSHQGNLTLCDPVDCSPSGSSVLGISQTGKLEWVAISSSGGSSQPRDRTPVSYLRVRFFTVWDNGKPILSIYYVSSIV